MAWLLLVYQLPARPSNLRVKTWRRLQKLGALAVKDSVYALPDSFQAREDLEWLKTEIRGMKGEATVFEAMHADAAESAQLTGAFREARAKEYAALGKEIAKLRRSAAPRPGRERTLRALRERWREIAAIDFFNAPGRDQTAAALERLERRAAGLRRAGAAAAPLRADQFRKRVWLTRPRPGVDRMSSAWLIRRFIDPRARFAFAARPDAVPAGIPFDMYGVEFGHQGTSCTFETLAQRFALMRRPAIAWLARIVHDVDLKDARFGAPEADVVARTVEGLRQTFRNDGELLERGMVFFEALYRSHSGSAPRGRRSRG